MLPTFIIAGPPKAGTSSLQHYIDSHPDIYIPDGEAHYFCEHFNEPSYYSKFFERWAGQKAVGEKTPCYFYYPEVPKRIKKIVPDVKLLFIYRNPIDRAHSQYWHNVRRGVETLPFEDAVFQAGHERIIDGRILSFYNKEPGLFSYLSIGQYADHIRRWKEYFNASQMYHIVLEDINYHLLHDVLRFLDVTDDFGFGHLKKFNVGGSPRSIRLMRMTRRFENSKLFHDFVDRLLNFKRGEYPMMDITTRTRLLDHFSPYNKEFKNITGCSIDKWKQ
jgi:hypothetical protein